MADKQFIIEVVEKGLTEIVRQLKQVNKEGEKLSSTQGKIQGSLTETDKLAKSHQRGLKGVGELTNNGTHAFSKMARTMDGTLVPAYATVAANVFALTAAFGALERAADLQILIDSAETLAVQTGRSLTGLATSMKEVTGNAISMKEALTSASIAASAGFDNSTIEQLTKVARNASVALGREMTDSLNRVFKGAIKAEPELLDELGIILRLDTAARKYAVTLNKTAAELTTFEKQQAVVNDVIEQGEKKFGRLSDVDPNPYTQLAAAFHDVSAALISVISIPINPAIEFLTDNIASLISILILFSTSVLKRAFPALTKLQSALDTGFGKALDSLNKFTTAIAEKGFKALSKAAQLDASIMTTTMADVVEQTVEGLEEIGSAGTKSFNKLKKGTLETKEEANSFLRVYGRVLQNLRKGIPSLGFDTSAETIKILQKRVDEVREAKNRLGTTTKTVGSRIAAFSIGPVGLLGKSLTSLTTNLNLTFRGLVGGIAAVNAADASFSSLAEAFKQTGKESGIFSKAFQKSAFVIGSGISVIFKAIPIIGSLIIAWQVLGSAIGFVRDLFFDEDIVKLNESLNKQKDALNSSVKSIANYKQNLEGLAPTLENITEKTEVLSNISTDLFSNLNEVISDIDLQGGFSAWSQFLDLFSGFGDLDNFKDNLEEVANQLSNIGLEDSVNKILREYNDISSLSVEESRKLGRELRDLAKDFTEVSKAAQESARESAKGIEELNKAFLNLSGTVPKLSEAEIALLGIDSMLRRIQSIGPLEGLTTISQLNTVALDRLGLTDISDDIIEVTQNFEQLTKEINKTKTELEEIRDSNFSILRQSEIDQLNDELDILNSELNIASEEIDRFSRLAEDKLKIATEEMEKLVEAKKKFTKEKLILELDISLPSTDVFSDFVNREEIEQSRREFLESSIRVEKQKTVALAEKELVILEKIEDKEREINKIKSFGFQKGGINIAKQRAEEELKALNLNLDTVQKEHEQFSNVYSDQLTAMGQSWKTTVDLIKKELDLLYTAQRAGLATPELLNSIKDFESQYKTAIDNVEIYYLGKYDSIARGQKAIDANTAINQFKKIEQQLDIPDTTLSYQLNTINI
jgi:hypothetical protein